NAPLNIANLQKPLITYALHYASLGWPVFPLHGVIDGRCGCNKPGCGSKGKHPRNSNGFKGATTDQRQLTQTFSKLPNSNIGIATGAPSGIFVIDVDPRNGGDLSLEALKAQ